MTVSPLAGNALQHFDHTLIEHVGKHDVAGEQLWPVLVGDAELVSEATGNGKQRPLALPLEERIRPDRGAHLHRFDPLCGKGIVRTQFEQFTDALRRGIRIPIGILRKKLVGAEGTRPARGRRRL